MRAGNWWAAEADLSIFLSHVEVANPILDKHRRIALASRSYCLWMTEDFDGALPDMRAVVFLNEPEKQRETWPVTNIALTEAGLLLCAMLLERGRQDEARELFASLERSRTPEGVYMDVGSRRCHPDYFPFLFRESRERYQDLDRETVLTLSEYRE